MRTGGTPHPLTDLYYRVLAGRWRGLMLLIAAVYLGVNAAFAALYLLDPGGIANARPGSYADAFHFSVQTLSTIGYGNMYPVSHLAKTLVLAEAVTGLLCTALATGLVFAKFARPQARVVFSDKILWGTLDERPVVMFRVGNARGNELVEASIRVSVLLPEQSPEGHRMRRLHDLALRRAQTPLFALSWLVVHEIDAASPLHGLDADDLRRLRARIIVSLVGVDATFSQQVHARHIYTAEDMCWGRRFVDVLHEREDGVIEFDISRIHDTTPA